MTIKKRIGYKRTTPRIINGQWIEGWLNDSLEDANSIFTFLCQKLTEKMDLTRAIRETKKRYQGVRIECPPKEENKPTLEITVG